MGKDRTSEALRRQLITPLLPKLLARGVSRLCRTSMACIQVADISLLTLIHGSKSLSLSAVHLVHRSASCYIESASSFITTLRDQDPQHKEDHSDGLDQVVSYATEITLQSSLLVSFGVALGFGLVEDVSSQVLSMARNSVHATDVIFGYTETSQAFATIINQLTTEIYPNYSTVKLLWTISVFLTLQQHTRSDTSLPLNVLWDAIITQTDDQEPIEIELSRVGEPIAETTLDIINLVGPHVAGQGVVPYEMRVTENTIEHVTMILNDEVQEWEREYVTERKKFGLLFAGQSPSPIVAGEGLAQTDISKVFELVRYTGHMSASYGRSFLHFTGIATTVLGHDEHMAFAAHCNISLEDIIYSSYVEPKMYRFSSIPVVYFITVDREKKALVVTLRGTLDLQDILTDAMFSYTLFQWQGREWKAHNGMLRSAKLFLESPVIAALASALQTYKDYSILFCGHSLGAGVGALVSILLTEPQVQNNEVTFTVREGFPIPAGTKVECLCYGPPATVSSELANLTAPMITSVIHSDDVISSLSLGLLWDLKKVAAELDKYQDFLTWLSPPSTAMNMKTKHYWHYVLNQLRNVMDSEKLVPPGAVYRIDVKTKTSVYPVDAITRRWLRKHRCPSGDDKGKHTQQVMVSQITDTKLYFREPLFSSTMFQHSPFHYQQALRALDLSRQRPRDAVQSPRSQIAL